MDMKMYKVRTDIMLLNTQCMRALFIETQKFDAQIVQHMTMKS
jgi:hypothetical protein